jgi:hypothetical protein
MPTPSDAIEQATIDGDVATFWVDDFEFETVDVRCYVDQRCSDPDQLFARTRALLDAVPAKLLDRLTFMVFHGIEPEISREGRPLAGSAYRLRFKDGQLGGKIVIPGRDHAQEEYRRLQLAVIEHELAHLNGGSSDNLSPGGPPDHLVARWRQAQVADARHQQTLPILPAHTSSHRIDGSDRRFLHGQWWLVDAAIEQAPSCWEREDWAEAVSCWCREQRQGYLWTDGHHTLTMGEYYPYRAKIIAEWMTAEDIATPTTTKLNVTAQPTAL